MQRFTRTITTCSWRPVQSTCSLFTSTFRKLNLKINEVLYANKPSETKGKTLEEIAASFGDRVVDTRMTSDVHKPVLRNEKDDGSDVVEMRENVGKSA